MTEYKILSANSTKDLEIQVAEYISNLWELHGGLAVLGSIAKPQFFQRTN